MTKTQFNYTRDQWSMLPLLTGSNMRIGLVVTCDVPDCKCFHRITDIRVESGTPQVFLKCVREPSLLSTWLPVKEQNLRIVSAIPVENPIEKHIQGLVQGR